MMPKTLPWNPRKSVHRLILLGASMLACAVLMWAQATSSVSGRATDSSGAAIAGAKVTVRNLETGATRESVSNETGFYRVLSLPVGQFEIRIEKDGFQREIRNGINLVVGQEAVVNVSLQVGELLQEVTVSAEAQLVNTTTAETSGLVGEREVKDLPLNGRSFDNLITLNAGTVNFTSMHTSGSAYTGGLGNRFSVSGRRTDANLFLLNGVEYGGNGSIATSPGSVSRQLLGIDAIREFNVLRDNYSAEYGKRAGGQISIVTMSGTNQFHGSAFEFLRNSVLDARNFFDYPTGLRIPTFQRNNFGGSAGGPIRKDKMFVFGNYEGLRQRLGLSNVATVPDENARKGLLPNAQGQLTNVGVAPGVAPYLALWPLPNSPSTGGTGLYYNNPKQAIREDFGTIRMDQTISEKDALSEVYTIDDGESLTPQVTDTFTTSLVARSQIASATEIHIFSPSLLNTLTLGFSRAFFFSQDQPLIALPASLAFIQGAGIGRLSIGTIGGAGGGALSLAGAQAPIGSPRNLFTETDNVQITRGAHLISAGVWFARLQENSKKNLNIGQATFSTLGDLLQGKMQLFNASPFGIPLGLRSLQGAWYVQDTIKVRPNLTLNLGLRHEFTNGWNEVAGRFANYVLGSDGVIQDRPRIGSSMFTKNNAKRLFAPRVGLAWDPFGHGKTAVRAGFGIYYSLIDDLAFWSGKNPPFNQSIQIPNSTFPFPQIVPGVSLPGAQTAPLGVQSDLQTPVLVAYNVKVEQGLSQNLAFSAGYSGFHGYHDLGLVDINTARATLCSAALRNCPAGLADGTKYFPPGAPRRNPRIGSSKTDNSVGATYYNSLVLELTRRFNRGLTLRANYSWAKALDINTSPAAISNGATTVLDPENPLLDRGFTSYDVRNRFSLNFSYELPIGKAKALGSGWGSAADRLLSGWQINGIVNIQGGLPVDPQLGFNQSRNGNTSIPDRPSVNPNFSGTRYPRTVNKWFDPNAFLLPPAGTYGNAARDSLIGPGLKSVDLSFFKNTTVTEKLNLQFRAEGFNLFNHANFGVPNFLVLNPDGTVRSNAGQITTTATTSRQLQFGLRLVW